MNFTDTLGWTLLHFLWQGTAIALLTAGAEACVRRKSAQLRYAIACGGMMLMVAAIGVTFLWLASAPASASRAFTTGAAPAIAHAARTMARQIAAAPVRFSAWMPMLVYVWFAGVCAMAVRSLGGWVLVQRYR